MQFVNKPLALPGACKGCGAANKSGYIDTGWQEEFYGAIYFCRDCVFDMASYFGAVSPEKYNRLLDELNKAKQELTKAEIERRANLNVMEGIDALVDLRASDRVSSLALVSSVAVSTAEAGKGERVDLAKGAGPASQPGDDKDLGSLRSSKSAKSISI